MERNLRKDKQPGCVGLMMEFYRDINGKVIEGFLGDSNECEILFILREPNNKGEKPDGFWFKKVLSGEKSNGGRYVGVLGRVYNLIKREKNTDQSVLIDNLKKCCYINIHPHFGYSSASKEYTEMLENFKKHVGEGAKNRWKIIDGLIKEYGCKCIVTVPEIFSILCPKDRVTSEFVEYDNKNFRVGKYKDAMVYEFYHPSYPRISYDKLNVSKIRRKI